MVLNKDFRDFIELLNANGVEYLIVGGYAVGFHGYPRYTKDLDVWILVSHENANRVMESLSQFGFGDVGLKNEDFLKLDEFVQLGFPPNRIDIVTSCDGVEFKTCYLSKVQIEIEGLKIDFIDLRNQFSDNQSKIRSSS